MWRGPTPINRDQQAGGSGDLGRGAGRARGPVMEGAWRAGCLVAEARRDYIAPPQMSSPFPSPRSPPPWQALLCEGPLRSISARSELRRGPRPLPFPPRTPVWPQPCTVRIAPHSPFPISTPRLAHRTYTIPPQRSLYDPPRLVSPDLGSTSDPLAASATSSTVTMGLLKKMMASLSPPSAPKHLPVPLPELSVDSPPGQSWSSSGSSSCSSPSPTTPSPRSSPIAYRAPSKLSGKRAGTPQDAYSDISRYSSPDPALEKKSRARRTSSPAVDIVKPTPRRAYIPITPSTTVMNAVLPPTPDMLKPPIKGILKPPRRTSPSPSCARMLALIMSRGSSRHRRPVRGLQLDATTYSLASLRIVCVQSSKPGCTALPTLAAVAPRGAAMEPVESIPSPTTLLRHHEAAIHDQDTRLLGDAA